MDITNNNSQQLLDSELSRLLAHAPAVDIPVDFATRVRSALPTQAAIPTRAAHSSPRATRRSQREIAHTVAIVCAVVIAAALFALAPHAQAGVNSVGFWMEIVLLAELGGIAYWLTVKRTFAE